MLLSKLLIVKKRFVIQFFKKRNMGNSSPQKRQKSPLKAQRPETRGSTMFTDLPVNSPQVRLSKEQLIKKFWNGKTIKRDCYFNDIEKKGRIPTKQASLISPQTGSLKVLTYKEKGLRLQFIQEVATESQIMSLVNNEKDTYEIKDLYNYPQSACGAVTYDLQPGQTNSSSYNIGTGCIIGPKQVLTCAHNLINLDTRQECSCICFTPSPCFPSTRYSYKAKNIYYYDQFKKYDASHTTRANDFIFIYDFAIIELDTEDNLEEIFGSLSFNFTWQQMQENQTAIIKNCEIIGYRIINQNQTPSLTHLSGDILLDGNVIKHRMDTKIASSGSPILEKIKGQYFVRGIHNAQVGNYKTGISLNEHMMNSFKELMSVPYIFFDFNGYYVSEKIIGVEGLKEFNEYLNKSNIEEQDIKEIDVSKNNIGDEGCMILKDMAKLKHMRSAHLSLNNITARGCFHLKNAKWDHLQRLGIWSNNIGPEGCYYLKETAWPKLKFIDLNGNKIGAGGCLYLSQTKWESLQTLYMWNNNIGDEGCQYLKSGKWNKLRQLDLQLNNITSKGCFFLSQAPWQLQTLAMWSNNIGVDGLRMLKTKHWVIQWEE